MSNRRKLAYVAILGNIIIWGAALPLVKPALNHIESFHFLFLRYLIAAPLMIPLIIKFAPKSFSLKDLGKITLIESLQIIGQLFLLYLGLRLTTAIESSLINSISPVLVTLGGIIFLHEKEEKNEWQGLIISIIGTLIVIVAPYVSGKPLTSDFSTLGNILVLLSTFSWAAYVLLAKKHFKKVNKTFVTGISSWLGLIFYTLVVLTTTPLTTAVSAITIPSVALAALYMGILGTPIAVSLYLYGQDRIEASEATLFSYLQPLIYIPLAVFWLKETLYPLQLVGLLFVALGVFLAERRT